MGVCVEDEDEQREKKESKEKEKKKKKKIAEEKAKGQIHTSDQLH